MPQSLKNVITDHSPIPTYTIGWNPVGYFWLEWGKGNCIRLYAWSPECAKLRGKEFDTGEEYYLEGYIEVLKGVWHE